MGQRRLLAGVICLAAAVLCVYSVYEMAGKVRLFNAQAHIRYYTFTPMNAREFTAYGREVKVEDVPGDEGADEAGGLAWGVRVSYGDASVVIPVKRPPVKDAPNLAIYDEWFAVVMYERLVPEGEAAGEAGLVESEGDGRGIVAMTRVPPPGYDPATWGAVKRADWSFRFYELKADGTIEERSRRWPRSDRSNKTLARTAAGERGTAEEQAVARLIAGITPLDERELEYQLALHVIPKLSVPSYKFKNTAMEAMGWTLPTAFFSMLVAILAGAAACAPKVKVD